MQQKTNYKMLSATCVIIFTGLLIIQLYLLRNTYRLSLSEYQSSVTTAFLREQSNPIFKAIEEEYNKILDSCSSKFEKGEFNELQFKSQLIKKSAIIAGKLDSTLSKSAVHNLLLKGVTERVAYTYIEIQGPSRKLIPVTRSAPPLAINARNDHDGNYISIGQNTGSLSTNTNGIDLNITYSLAKELEIPPFPATVLKQLLIVAGLSFLLLSGVVFLFYQIMLSERRQRKIAELRSDLVNNITHELKTPLSSMSIAFKTLKYLGNEHQEREHNKVLEVLERQHHKLKQTVERVLDSAMLPRQNLSATADINSLLAGYRNYYFSESHKVSVKSENIVCLVFGTTDIIEGVIDNLLDNAQKYSAPLTSISVTGKSENGRFRIDITDCGIGIPNAYKDQLFDKFYRVPENNLHSVKGLGLGLYLSQQSMQSIGGDIKLTRSSPAGSTFTIYLSIA